MLVYKYPGSMIEYLAGKVYDFKVIEESQLDVVKLEGWGATPDEAELYSMVKPVEEPASVESVSIAPLDPSAPTV